VDIPLENFQFKFTKQEEEEETLQVPVKIIGAARALYIYWPKNPQVPLAPPHYYIDVIFRATSEETPYQIDLVDNDGTTKICSTEVYPDLDQI